MKSERRVCLIVGLKVVSFVHAITEILSFLKMGKQVSLVINIHIYEDNNFKVTADSLG